MWRSRSLHEGNLWLNRSIQLVDTSTECDYETSTTSEEKEVLISLRNNLPSVNFDVIIWHHKVKGELIKTQRDPNNVELLISWSL